MDIPHLLPLLLRTTGWIALLLLLAAPFLPGMQTCMNIAAIAGIVVIGMATLPRRIVATTIHGEIEKKEGSVLLSLEKGFSPSAMSETTSLRHLGLPLLAYLLYAIFGTLYAPAAGEASLPERLASAHDLWHLLRALIAAGLGIVLLRSRHDVLCLLALLTLLLFQLGIWAPIDHWLRGDFFSTRASTHWARLVGSKNNSARYAWVLYLGLYYVWILFFTTSWNGDPDKREERNNASMESLSPLWRWGGWIAAIVVPIILVTRKELLDIVEGSGFLPGGGKRGDRAAYNESFYIAAGCIAILGIVVWEKVFRRPKARRILAVTVLGIVFLNIALTGTRMALALSLLAAALILLLYLRQRPELFFRRLPVFALVAFVILLLFGVRYPDSVMSKASLEQRANVWGASLELIEERQWLGWGYGTSNFQKAYWPRFGSKDNRAPASERYGLLFVGKEYRPQTRLHQKVSHAHNLYIQILVEGGIVGLGLFFWLWGTLLRFLLRRPFSHLPRRDMAIRAEPNNPSPLEQGRTPLPADPSFPSSFARSSLSPARIVALMLLLLLFQGLLEVPLKQSDLVTFGALIAIGLRFVCQGEGRSS